MRKRSKKSMVIATAVLVGTLTVGGTTYGVVKSIEHKQAIGNAKSYLQVEQTSIRDIKAELGRLVNKDGFVSAELTMEKLNGFENSLNSIKDSHTDFNIKTNALKNEIEVIKIDKQDVIAQIKDIKAKLSLQDSVNSLFTDSVINGEKVESKSIADGLTKEQISEVSNSVNNFEDADSKWFNTLHGLVTDATQQVNQIEIARDSVGIIVDGDKVMGGVSREQYTALAEEVGKVKNETVKKELNKELDKVLKVVEQKEEEIKLAQAEKERVEKEQAEKEQQVASSQTGNSSNGTVTNRVSPPTNTSNTTQKPATNTNTQKPATNTNTQKPATNTQKPATQKPATNTQKPATQKPATQKPSTQKPATNTQKPATQQPSTNNKGKGAHGVKDSEGVIDGTNGNGTWESGTVDNSIFGD